MKCDFCGREIDKGVLECPYCHYQIKAEPQVLSPTERDTFDGITIEEDGRESSSGADNQMRNDNYGGGFNDKNVPPQIKVRTFGCSSGLLMTLLILGGILALIFFLLPAFLIFAAIGAVVVFLLRLFV